MVIGKWDFGDKIGKFKRPEGCSSIFDGQNRSGESKRAGKLNGFVWGLGFRSRSTESEIGKKRLSVYDN